MQTNAQETVLRTPLNTVSKDSDEGFFSVVMTGYLLHAGPVTLRVCLGRLLKNLEFLSEKKFEVVNMLCNRST